MGVKHIYSKQNDINMTINNGIVSCFKIHFLNEYLCFQIYGALVDHTKFASYDPSQEPIFPNELQVTVTQ